MKKFQIFFFFFILFFNTSQADHFVGYDMCLINIKNTNGSPTNFYKWRLRIYRDITGPVIPPQVQFNLYKQSDNSQIGNNIYLNKKNLQTFLTYPPEDCAPPQAQLSVELGIYESNSIDYSTLNDPSGYYIASSKCCRNFNIVNVNGNSAEYGIVFTMDIPNLSEDGTKFNSSPEFKNNPMTIFSVGKPYTLDWNVQDPDGDSLSFSIVQPLGEGNTKPHTLIPFASGYNLNYNIIDGVPDLTINPHTGIINFIPTKAGKYLVAFKVDEWRIINDFPTKIGSIRREYQLEVVLNMDAPPVIDDINNQKNVIVDTIYYPNEYTLNFTSRDSPNDSIFMYIQPDISPGENILNPNTHNAEWGEVGNLSSGLLAQNLVIKGKGILQAQFNWSPKCSSVRNNPYKFAIIVRDQTCPSPFYDTTFVTLFVKKKVNSIPIFINKSKTQPDDIKLNQLSKIKTRKYYLEAGDLFQLSGDSAIKTFDGDSTQVVNIFMSQDFLHNPRITVNPQVFSVSPHQLYSSANFYWQTTCLDRSDTSYIFKICAYDDNCSKRDSAFLNIEIFIRDKSNRKPFFSKANPDSVYIREGEVDSFIVTLYDTIRYNLNKYKHIQLVPDLSDFASVQINGGSILHYNNLEGLDSLKVKFTWAPNCNNIRTEPYRLYLKAYDEGCPRLIRNDTIYVFVQRPMNTEPVFLDQNNNQISIVDTTIFAGDVFKYKFFAIDTNQRFDSVYISLDKSTEISDPTKVSNVVENVSTNAKRKAYSELIWKTTCSDTRSEAYIADIIARDNECKNPKQSILKFKITVKDRPNYLPQFPFSNQSVTVDTIYAGELFTFNLSAVDSNAAGLLTLDTIYTNIPSDLIKPSFDKVSGDNGDTLKSKLIWNTDCSLIRDEPYFIKLGAWIGPCTNPQDTAFHILKLYISKNPALNPKFISGSDTTITLIVGDKYSLDLNAASQIEGGSIEITSKSMIYNNIPGNLAVFEQYGNGKATFSWETSCEHIRDSSYIVYFYASNPICKTNEAGFKVKFNVLPKSDFISPLPNAFSPNGDHINDTYSIYKQYIVTCDPGFRFIVYNRWGKIVFESTNPEFEWDAEGLGAGTYFYTLESRARSQNGTIDIIK